MNFINFSAGLTPHKIFADAVRSLQMTYLDVRKKEQPGPFKEVCDVIDLLSIKFGQDRAKLVSGLRGALTEALKYLDERFQVPTI